MNAFIFTSLISSIVVSTVADHAATDLPSTSESPSNDSANWITGKGTFHCSSYWDNCIWKEPWEKETNNCQTWNKEKTYRCREEDCCWWDLETAKEWCGKSSECAGFSTFYGRYIARGHAIPYWINYDWSGQTYWIKNDSRTYLLEGNERARQEWEAEINADIAGYTNRGLGGCRHGWYDGWNRTDAASVYTCAAKCDSEPECRHFTLKKGISCSRFGSSGKKDCKFFPDRWSNEKVTFSKIFPGGRTPKPTPAPTPIGMTHPPTSERYFMYEHMSLSPCDREEGIPGRCTYVTNVSGKDLCACDKKGVGYCNRTVKEGWCSTNGEDIKKLKKSLKRCAKSCIDHWFDEA